MSELTEGSRVRHLDTGRRGTVRKVLNGRSVEVEWDGRSVDAAWTSDLRLERRPRCTAGHAADDTKDWCGCGAPILHPASDVRSGGYEQIGDINWPPVAER